MKVKIETISNEKIAVFTPYTSRFVKKARDLQGEWSDTRKAWIFHQEELCDVKNALLKIYGEDGATPVEYCTLHITNYNKSVSLKGVELFGRSIAYATGKRSGAKISDDIIWLEGEYNSGGSNAYWETIITNGEFKIKNFPITLINKKVKDAIEEGWCKIIRKELAN